MTTREDIYAAIKNADAAGDSESVRKLGEYLQTMPAEQPKAAEKTGYLESVKNNIASSGQAFNQALTGAVRGAAGIGTVLQRPFESAQRNAERKASLDDFFKERTDPTSGAFQLGKLGAEVAGTAGVGGAIAAPVKALGGAALAPLANAIASSGLSTGARVAPGLAARAADMGTRMVGGGITGGASMAAIDPEHVGTGVAIGLALPPVLRVGGDHGSDVLAKGWNARSTQPRAAAAADDLAKALGIATPEQKAALIEQLRLAPELLTNPTVAQALQTPEAGILQRVVHDSPGGKALREKVATQAAARTARARGRGSRRSERARSVARRPGAPGGESAPPRTRGREPRG
jgi:hypothetical protein